MRDQSLAGKLMLHKTRGIVFHSLEYGDTSLVVKIYTELYGLQSYIVNSVRTKKAKTRQNLFQPLTLLDLVVYHKDRPGLQRISEVKPSPVLETIPFDIEKISLALFIDEVLIHAIREEESNQELFDFIFKMILKLDQSESQGNFHLYFLIQLTRYLGFYPSNNFSDTNKIFNLIDGQFQSSVPNHVFYLDGPFAAGFSQVIDASVSFSSRLKIPAFDRKKYLEALLEYYKRHIDSFGEIKSLKVLEQIWG